jgi:tetratricopeptide (TPR) repeat protein
MRTKRQFSSTERPRSHDRELSSLREGRRGRLLSLYPPVLVSTRIDTLYLEPAYTKEDTPFNITYHTPSQDIADDPAELSAIEEDAIPPVATIIAPPPSPSSYQPLEEAPFSQLYGERVFELANVIKPEFENASPGPGRLGDTPNNAWPPLFVHDLAWDIIDAGTSETCQPFTRLSTTQLDAHSHELLEKQHEDSPMPNLSLNETFDSLSIGPPASKDPEIPGTGISPTDGVLAGQFAVSLAYSGDGVSPWEIYSESSSIWRHEEIDVLSGPAVTSEIYPVSVDFSTPKVETAVLEALALNSNRNVISLEFSQIAKLPVFDGVAINYSSLCESLGVLSNRYLKRDLLGQARMAVRLMELVQAELFKHSSISAKCNFQKARILRKENDYERSVTYISQAIASYERFGEKNNALKCQLFLGDTLLSQGRCSEALHVFVAALIEHRRTQQGSDKVMASIQNLHIKMNTYCMMEEVIFISSTLGDLLGKRGAIVYSRTFDIWAEFAQLGSGYSKLELFEIADLCFEVPEPVLNEMLPNASYYIRRSQVRKEYSLHSLRQGKTSQALTQVTLAFECIQSIGTGILPFGPIVLPGGRTSQDSRNVVSLVLEELRNVLIQATPGITLPEEVYCYEKANFLADKISWNLSTEVGSPLVLHGTDSRKHEKNRNQIGKDKIRAPSIRGGVAASISSSGSSIFSIDSTSSRPGLTYSVGSASSYVSNSAFMVDSDPGINKSL